MHPAFKEGPSISASNLWAEWKACQAFGLDPDIYFAKDRLMRAFIVGGHIASESLHAMIQYDLRPKDKK